MRYTRLGSSGLKISRVAMGRMSFGEGDSGREGWPIPYEDAVPFFRQALDHGIAFWDTAKLAWVLKNPAVDAPIVGVTKQHHLVDARAALDLELTDGEVAAREEPYVLRQATGSDPGTGAGPLPARSARNPDFTRLKKGGLLRYVE